MSIPNPYEVLRVEPTATAAEIGRAYRRLMRLYHPDTRLGTRGHEEQRSVDGLLRRVMDAYALLADPALKAEYDRQHRQAGAGSIRDSHRGDGSDPESPRPGPARGTHIHVEPVSNRHAVWLFPPANYCGRNNRSIWVIY